MIKSLWKAYKTTHALARDFIEPGDIVIDATCGYGRDTSALSHFAGADGKVYSLDLAPEAIRETGKYVTEHKKAEDAPVVLIRGNHAQLKELIPEEDHERIKLILFNLGYLPGYPHTSGYMTEPIDTLVAVKQALDIIEPGGAVIVVTYPHEQGSDEALGLADLAQELSDPFSAYKIERLNRKNPPSILIFTKGLETGGQE